jgi:hypothetical protein
MARLFSLAAAGAVDDPEHGHFDRDPDHGGFDFPDDLSDRLHRLRHRGRPAWETETERSERLHGDEEARSRDPKTLYSAVAEIAALAKGMHAASVPPEVAAEIADLKRQLAELAQAAAPAKAAPAKKAPAVA